MDIERLKELKNVVVLNSWLSERAKKELTTLIDEAIARQSVKSEEVAEAIDMLQVIRPVWFVTENGNPFESTDHDWGWRCGACDYEYPLEFDDPDRPPDYNYCPHCGQKIKE